MLDRTRLLAGRHLDHVVAHKIASAVGERKAAAGVVAVPPSRLECKQIVPKIKVDRNSFAAGPVAVWIEKKILWLVSVRNGPFVHCHLAAFPFKSAARGATSAAD